MYTYLQQLFYGKIYLNVFSDAYWNCWINLLKRKFSFANFNRKNLEQKIYIILSKMRSILFKEGKSNFFDQTWTEITEIIFSTSCKKA